MAKFNKSLQVNEMAIQNEIVRNPKNENVILNDGQLNIIFKDQAGNQTGSLKVKSVQTQDVTNTGTDNLFDTSDEDEVFITAKAFKNYITYLINNNRKY